MEKIQSDYNNMIRALEKKVEILMTEQVMDEQRLDYGGYFSGPTAKNVLGANYELGFASPYHVGNALFITMLGYAYLSPESRYYNEDAILDRLSLSISFQERCRRTSGLFDLPFTNFDSPTDTAFSVASIGRVAWMAQKNTEIKGAKILEDLLKPYLIQSADAIAPAGFHTPNHRWVIVGALSQVMELYPENDYSNTIELYLAEGIDINEDGEYSERSSGAYNAVINTHLIQAAESLNRWELLESVSRNLEFMTYLFHEDWSVVNSISLRQDKGVKTIPVNILDSFYYMARHDNNAKYAKVAEGLLRNGGETNIDLIYWYARHPEWHEEGLQTDQVTFNAAKHMKSSNIWRVRRDKMSGTLATDVSGVFSLKYGEVQLREVRLFAPYFAGAKFKGETLEVEGNTATMILKSEFLLPQLPGYWMPLGREVPFGDLPFNNLEQRALNKRPEFTFILNVTEVEGGFDLYVQSEGGMDKVPFIVEFLFDVPGEIELQQASFPATADTTILLKEGYLTYRVGNDAITIGPGFYGHRSVNVATEGTGGATRIVMSDWTQIDRKIEIRCNRWTESEGPCFSSEGPARIERFN